MYFNGGKCILIVFIKGYPALKDICLQTANRNDNLVRKEKLFKHFLGIKGLTTSTNAIVFTE